MFNKRKRFLAKEIQKLIDNKIEGFTSTETTDSINNFCDHNYTRLEVTEALLEAGFSIDKFEWRAPVESNMNFVDGIILLTMAAFVGFSIYLVIIQIFG